MKIYHGFNEAKNVGLPCVYAIGNFDGVHLGHLSLIRRASELALSMKAQLGVYTFWPHPQVILRPNTHVNLICTREQKMRIFEEHGVASVVEEPFSLEFAVRSAQSFAEDVIAKGLKARAVVTGENFRFGHQALGTPQKMFQWLARFGIEHDVVPSVSVNGSLCSSSAIRHAILKGSMVEAASLLGRFYSIVGTVVKGAGRGQSIGIPTANLQSVSSLIPGSGVYKTLVRIAGGDELFSAATNIGTRPTFSGDPQIHIETHLMGFDKRIYGQPLEIFFVRKIRDEKKFETVEALVKQIHEDIAAASQR